MKQWQWRRGAALFGAFTAVLLLIGLFWPASGSDREVKKASADTTSTTATTVAPTPDSECPNSWGRLDRDKTNNQWIHGGVLAIKQAKTPEEARTAITEWTQLIRTDPALLAGGVRWLLHKDVKADELFDSKGCATSLAVGLVDELGVAYAFSSMTPDQAPATGYNSGADPNGGGVHVAGSPGIKGDRTAVRIDLPDGTTVWVMARCGNPVTMKPPSGVPHGPTDNNPPPTTTTTTPPGETTSTTRPRGSTTTTTRPTTSTTVPRCPPGMHGTPPICKDDGDRDPEPRGNNRPGGGGTAPPISGPAGPPAAGPPPATYVPPPPPTAPPTTRPTGSTAPPAPSTTTAPPTTGPPVTGDPGGF